MLITKEKILKDSKFKDNLVASLIFIITGFLILLAPFTVANLDKMNFIATIIILSLVFVLPFECAGFVFLTKAILLRNNIKNGNFYILIDEITGVKRSKRSGTSDVDTFSYLTLKNYTSKTGKKEFIDESIFSKVAVGQKCTLIFIGNNKESSFIYPGDEYMIDESLKDKIVDNIN